MVIAGDGDGIVDAAAAGLVTGHERVSSSHRSTTPRCATRSRTGAALVLTDSNRRRNTSFFASIRDTKSPTLRAGQVAHSADGYDRLVDLFADSLRRGPLGRGDAAAREVTTSNDGGVDRAEDRGTRAFDGDLTTAWRVGGADPLHSWIDGSVPTGRSSCAAGRRRRHATRWSYVAVERHRVPRSSGRSTPPSLLVVTSAPRVSTSPTSSIGTSRRRLRTSRS